MRLRNFTAPTMQEAMARVHQELGGDAIIVSTDDTVAGDVRVTAAVDEAEPRLGSALAGPDVTDRLSEALAADGGLGTLAEKILIASLYLEPGVQMTALARSLVAVIS